jgi:hypothetical protein
VVVIVLMKGVFSVNLGQPVIILQRADGNGVCGCEPGRGIVPGLAGSDEPAADLDVGPVATQRFGLVEHELP